MSCFSFSRGRMENLISVIVPIYDVEKYLPNCIDSIIGQHGVNLELILVDDGSPDRCPEICDEYEKSDSRIRVVHQENRGLSSARNRGIEMATGNYLFFVDSDDWLLPGALEMMLNRSLEQNSDIVCCGITAYDEETGQEEMIFKQIDMELTPDEALRELVLSVNTVRNFAWNKLYRAFRFNSLRFPEGRYSEDLFVMHELIGAAEHISYIGKALYCYRIHSKSFLHGRLRKESLDILWAYESRIKYLRDRELEYLANESSLDYVLSAYNLFQRSRKKEDDENSKFRRQLRTILRNARNPVLLAKGCSLKKRISCFIKRNVILMIR